MAMHRQSSLSRDSIPRCGNRKNLEEFLKSRDKNGNAREVRKCLEYTSYTIYLDPADDEAENEIVFK